MRSKCSSVFKNSNMATNTRYSTEGLLAVILLMIIPFLSFASQQHSAPLESTSTSGWSPNSFGIKLGGGFAQHVGTQEREQEYAVSSGWRTGVSAGVFFHWPVTSRLGLQQELLYSQKGSRQEIGVDILEIPTILNVTYNADYMDIPVMARLTMLNWDGGELYSMSGTAMSLKLSGSYSLEGTLDDGTEIIPISAEGDLSEVDMFDFSMVYATGIEFMTCVGRVLAEYRFSMSWNTLMMPTYAYVPFEEEQLLVENEPVPLKNQSHSILLGIRF